ncbi:hypothetical protein DLE60_34490 [Micromonospora globispora]|uniref:hypothetical protein n=1 Tax=Micromonospora globispora TaxID=1450148 RepID=UPI000D6FB604|nr:hypothetical protein [Micromonospora globispora]PWU48224.1 hypothetical protein DLE60_34490 [Micromonospora globispora]RQW91118.1 hypothetical protein DKL51_21510 [Micromonospora globispora]
MGTRITGVLRRRLRWRGRRAAGFLGLLAVSAALLAWGRVVTGYNQELLLNIGASIVIVAFSYAIVDPLFEELRRSRVEEHPHFDDEEFSAHVAAASSTVSIMDIGSHLLEGPGRDRFLRALRTALGNGVLVRVLLLDPDSAAASQRAEEIRPVNVREVIVDNLRRLNEFAESLDAETRARLQVRIYDASPTVHMFRWDDKALISFFPVGVRASAAPHLEVFMGSPLGEFVESRFDELWGHPSTRRLDEYICLPMALRYDGVVLRSCLVHFVVLPDGWCIDGSPIVDQLTDHGTGPLEVELSRPLVVDGWSGTRFRLARVDGDAQRARVFALFDVKYGPRRLAGPGRARLALRLIPRLEAAGDDVGSALSASDGAAPDASVA